MTAISKYPEQPHVVVIEPSTTATSAASAAPTTTTTALNDENDNSNNLNGTIVVDVDDTSKRKWRYYSSDNAEDEDVDAEGDADAEDGEENEANCSGYDDDLIRISSPVPTFPNIPWSRSRKYHPDLEGLHYELLECYDWLRPTEAERFARVNVCQRVRNVLVDICPDAIFYVFGSVATNLFLPTSDIDISVELQRLTQYDMQIVAAAFRNSKNFKDVNVLDRVHVPIIKLTDRETSINIDISFNTSNAHSAVQYIMYMRFWYPAVELFTLILKQFLATRQLNQAFTGGLSSYGLILMIVHYMLRHYRNIFFAKDLSQLPIGILSKFLMGFLEYYGQKFNPLNDALAFPRFDEAVLMSKSHLTSMMNEDFFASILCIQDPLTPVNDVGRGCHNFMHVRAAFLSAWTMLKKKLELNRSMRCGKPMLESIMTFSNNFVQFRRKINCLPFENICEHDGNTPYIFGGQPLQEMGFETEARTAMLYPAGGILPLPRMYFPAPAAAVSPSFVQQQQHFQAQQPGQGGYDENGCIEQISTSSSEPSSTTPTAFSSPRGPTDFQQSEYYSNSFQFPPHHQQQQIFFPPFQQLQHPRQIYSYNPYFAAAAGLSPTSFHQHPPLFPPPFHHHPQHLQQHYINDYGNGNDISDYGSTNNEYASSNNDNGEYCGYSDAYYSSESAQQQQQDMISEDDFNKMLSFNSAVEDENDDSKCCSNNNNGNISDDSSTSSSGLSTGSSDSIISCSTVTPESYDDQFSTTTDAPSTTEEGSMKSGS